MAAFVVFYTGTGFVFYLLLGQDMHKRKMFRIKEVEDHISKDIRQQEYRLRSRDVQEMDDSIRGYEDLVMYNLEAGEAMLTKDNDVDIFIDGNEKFRALMKICGMRSILSISNTTLLKTTYYSIRSRIF